jgi:lipoprotein signal peptidase
MVFSVDRVTKAFIFGRHDAGKGRSRTGWPMIRPIRNRKPWPWPSGSRAALLGVLALGMASAGFLILTASWVGTVADLGFGAALGGALGNAYDRVRHGAILDFVDLGWGGVFNVADAALVLGLLTVLLSFLAAIRGVDS